MKYGHIKHDEVQRAMELLKTAKLAEVARDGTWQVAWENLHSPRERELERILARRACDPPASSRPAAVRRQLRGRQDVSDGQLRLFGAPRVRPEVATRNPRPKPRSLDSGPGV
jgi:hypothetical protein